ncbi:hypothetical protein BOW53_06895 [Solemya pervernicosa gill symbiont]|uniref:DUF1015 domain-containing protein n=2 Tax=Gammaproteobacteria incertae sedis TaxID=118884 RepID=A0A1T2L6B6_9GAMM|nr:DUF1015 domain-containing protein [Candidatus Reidiella endopervernicosa]OOZ40649.1 hypothetical protein BOW53_06895 [Solemya pervernicosa gill symbiont]QKQ27405.1 DUF1015 domain-containing protein [Candidatus Reidiella endopervernicosa]
MSLIRPFTGLRPVPERAADVAAPPYDVLNTAEARERVVGKPLSFLHISKPEIDLPEGTDPFDASVYAKGAENLQRLISDGVLIRDDSPCYYLYQLEMDGHIQTGLVAAASVEAYDENRIRKHEFTRPEKEDDRVRQVDALNAQTGPVFLVHKYQAEVETMVREATAGEPLYNLTADDGIRHTLWVMDDAAKTARLTELFDAMPCIYVADGHHRSAAASRVCASRKTDNSNHSGEESYNYFLTVIFPDNEMQILDYNRVVADMNGLDRETFLSKAAESFTVTAETGQVKPGKPQEFGMYLQEQWYRLTINSDLVPANDPVGQLDVSLLQNNLIEPLLGISDPRRDKRIDFVGGIRGMDGLEKRVDSGEMTLAFSLFATGMADLMAVADANEVMPPKSTWFEPKLADGLVSHVLD